MKTIYLMPLEAKSYNYGGVLQEYALQEKCKELGYEVKIINDIFLERQSLFSVKGDIRNFTFSWLILKIKGIICARKSELSEENRNHLCKRREKFDIFRRQYMLFTESCKQTDLKKIVSDGYAVIVGSDQVWNPAMTSYPLFLHFVKEQKKIAYAASISRDSLSVREKKLMMPLIDDFDFVSVREERAKELLDSFCKIKSTVVLDPTLLVENTLWQSMTEKRLISDKYVFCYFLGDNVEIRKEASCFATDRGLGLVTIPLLKKENVFADEAYTYESCVEASPNDFLNLIRYAEYIVTDSFHAVVFSIVFNKQFFVIGRNMAGYAANSRITTLLGHFGLAERMASQDKLKDVICKNIDYADVEAKLKLLRQKSEEFLQNALKEEN